MAAEEAKISALSDSSYQLLHFLELRFDFPTLINVIRLGIMEEPLSPGGVSMCGPVALSMQGLSI
jgi:hypothetical protein